MTKKNKIPTIIALVLLVVGIVAGVLLVNTNQVFKLKATPDFTPQDVRITNITDTSFTVSWTTGEQTSGVITWGKTATTLNQPVNEDIANPGLVHGASIKTLSPKTTYYFKISAGGQDYNDNGIPWKVTTGPVLAQPVTNTLVSGTVLTATGSPVTQALVYLTITGASPLSTLTSQSGSYVIPISSARSINLASYIPIDNQHTVLEISVNAGPTGVSSAEAHPQTANPLPPMILGQIHDFKNLVADLTAEVPSAQVNLPLTEENPVSGFNVGPETPPVTTVTLDSLKDGEVVTSENPEFFGKGPAGTAISIKVESETPISDELNIPKNETWQWTPPAGINPGNHTITITWKDGQGIFRTLTRNFVVAAAAGPAFVATPSATLKPQSTATPVATASPILNAADAPVSGDLTPTLLLFMMSVGVISLSIVLWKKSEI